MVWYAWLLIAWFVFNGLTTITYIGKPRPTITPGIAIFVLIIQALYIWAIVSLAT